jgi:hypothetical protein
MCQKETRNIYVVLFKVRLYIKSVQEGHAEPAFMQTPLHIKLHDTQTLDYSPLRAMLVTTGKIPLSEQYNMKPQMFQHFHFPSSNDAMLALPSAQLPCDLTTCSERNHERR